MSTTVTLIALLLIAVTSGRSEESIPVEVNLTANSSVIGFNNKLYDAFLGIPYARPPVGDLRFKDPIDLSGIIGKHDATRQPLPCIQKNIFEYGATVVGSEDCLYLNIYRPNGVTSAKKLPILFFIHGGFLVHGSNSRTELGPSYWMDPNNSLFNPLILVVIQFRQTAMGFFSTGDSECPGNFGFKDQRSALRWVRQNIASFGGDVDQITVGGHGTGGSAAHLHMMAKSAISDRYFARVLVMSGSALSPLMYPNKDPLALARRHAEKLGIPDAISLSTKELVQAMRDQSAKSIVDTIEDLKVFDIDPVTLYGLVIEPDYPGAFMIQDPRESLLNGKFLKVPFLSGIVKFEGGYRAMPFISKTHRTEILESKMSETLLQILNLNISNKFTDAFLKYRNVPRPYLEDTEKFISMLGDPMNYAHYKQLQIMSKFMPKTVHSYSFSYNGTYSFAEKYANGPVERYGPIHGDDQIYLFNSHNLTTKRDLGVMKTMVSSICKFVGGAPILPVSEKSGVFKNIYKIRVDKNGKGKPKTHDINLAETMRFWNKWLWIIMAF